MESQLAAFARSFRALPARRFQELPGASETVKIRSLQDRQCTWFYVVNTSETPETLTVSPTVEQLRMRRPADSSLPPASP